MVNITQKHLYYIKAYLKTPFSDVSAPTLKGEHQKIRLPCLPDRQALGLRGKANFQFFEVPLNY